MVIGLSGPGVQISASAVQSVIGSYFIQISGTHGCKEENHESVALIGKKLNRSFISLTVNSDAEPYQDENSEEFEKLEIGDTSVHVHGTFP